MGCMNSKMTEEDSAAKQRAKQVNDQLGRDKEFDRALIKLLLLGAGESGKSTIFKQMRLLYGDGYDEETRRQMRSVIFSNIHSGTRTVLGHCDTLGFPIENEDSLKAADTMFQYSDDTEMNDEIAGAVKILWSDSNFQETFKRRANYQLFDCFAYFAKQLAAKYPEWGGDNWIPDPEACLQARVRTSGIVEEKYTIDGINFRMYDVGGQRNERKKWIHCFDGVTAIIFVGAISEYDQVLYEDKSQNRLVEAVELFDEITNSKWFTDTSIILFLNKKDLFVDKFVGARIPLNSTGLPFFNSWVEPNWDNVTPEQAVATAHQWILQQFLNRREDQTKEVYHHITCATDTQNVKTVFNSCKDIILRSNMKGSGFME